MPSPTPNILPSTTLSSLLSGLLAQKSPLVKTNLIICTTSTQFLHTLFHSALTESSPGSTSQGQPDLSNPTLGQLGTASHISTSFCPSVSSLLVLLAVLPYQLTSNGEGENEKQTRQKLVLISPLALLASSGSSSIQTLAQILCAAVECTNIGGLELEVVECISHSSLPVSLQTGVEEMEMATGDSTMEKKDCDPWDMPMSILSNTVGKLKLEKAGWTSRSVTPRTVASRWFHFS
jgi:hypothetical protein